MDYRVIGCITQGDELSEEEEDGMTCETPRRRTDRQSPLA